MVRGSDGFVQDDVMPVLNMFACDDHAHRDARLDQTLATWRGCVLYRVRVALVRRVAPSATRTRYRTHPRQVARVWSKRASRWAWSSHANMLRTGITSSCTKPSLPRTMRSSRLPVPS